MGQLDWVILLSPVGVVMAVFAVFVPFFLSMFNKMFMLSKQIEDSQRDFGEKLGEVQAELANVRTELANVRTEFGEKLREVQIGLSEDFSDLRVDVARLEGILAGAGIGNADAANPGRNVSDNHPRKAAPIDDNGGASARETPLAASSPRDG